jgi:hypothetical protein
VRTAATLFFSIALAAAGCARREIQVTSDPPGAIVWLNDQEIGRTPVTASFLYYGVYDVRLRLEGFEPVATARDTGQPWYEYPPLDLFAETWPWGVATRVHWHFTLEPALESRLPREELEAGLLGRASDLRRRTEGGP